MVLQNTHPSLASFPPLSQNRTFLKYEEDESALWADGTKLEAGEVASSSTRMEKTAPCNVRRTDVANGQGGSRSRGRMEKDKTASGEALRTAMDGIGFYMGKQQEAYDAELFAITRGIHHLALRH